MVKVSVLTPTWNRGLYLKRVQSALLNQEAGIFEWIVVDDGSNDLTEDVMSELMSNSNFPITYALFPRRVGKCRADNLLLDLASGDFVLWCDSDDALTPGAIKRLLNEWENIPPDNRSDFIGVVALCADPAGNIQSTGLSNFSPFVCTWDELSSSYKMAGDMCIMQNRQVIGDRRFPEHDLVITESGFWHQFMTKKILCLPDVLKIMIRDTENRISGSHLMEYCRGKAYAIAYADRERFNRLSMLRQLSLASRFHRYAIHGDLTIGIRNRLFFGPKPFMYYTGLVLGVLFAVKDILQGRVVKSHLIFEKGKSTEAVIERNTFADQMRYGSI